MYTSCERGRHGQGSLFACAHRTSHSQRKTRSPFAAAREVIASDSYCLAAIALMFFSVTELGGSLPGRLFTAHVRSTLDAPCTWASALQELKQGKAGTLMSETLAATPFPDFYWECRPASWSSIHKQQFEFAVLDAQGSLNRSIASPTSFANHLEGASASVVSFPNLGRDAELVVPAQSPGVQPDVYGHLANFIRNGPEDQKADFWRVVGEVMETSLKRSAPSPVWLSTAGNGVPWVHVRADSWPKYVKHQEFRSHDPESVSANGLTRPGDDEL